MPTSSSLVTNLPADFNTFGQAVDTSMSELLGGTTGQVLSKTSNTSMDFTWVTPTDQTPLTTKGDLFTFTTVDARLGVGTNGQYLQADSTEATGLKWATPAASTPTFVGCSVYRTTTLSVANNTETVIGNDAENFDTDGFHDNATNNSRLTIPAGKAGKYWVYGYGNLNGTGRHIQQFKLNGSFINNIDVTAPSSGSTGHNFGMIMNLAVADYVEFVYFQNSGSSQTVQAGTLYNQFGLYFIGA